MRGTWTIRIKALLLLVIFTANFVVFCPCSAAVDRTSSAPMRMKGHCCCCKTRPAGERNDCRGMQAIRFSLMAKKVAAAVQAGMVSSAAVARIYNVQPFVIRTLRPLPAFPDHPPHPPSDLHAFYQRYLI